MLHAQHTRARFLDGVDLVLDEYDAGSNTRLLDSSALPDTKGLLLRFYIATDNFQNLREGKDTIAPIE